MSLPGKAGDYAWTILGHVLSYAAKLVGEAADDIVAIDDAMKLGYNWKFGPFELIDQLGPGKLAERLAAEGRPVPALLKAAGTNPFYRIEGGKRQYLRPTAAIATSRAPRAWCCSRTSSARRSRCSRTGSAALWDVGDGVAAIEFTGKMNALDEEVIKLINQAIPLVKASFKALIVYNEGSNFSAGANLGLAMFAINIAAWSEVEKLDRRRAGGVQGAQIRTLPGGVGAGRSRARRRLRDLSQLRCDPGACRNLYRPRRMRRRADPGLGRQWRDARSRRQGQDDARGARCPPLSKVFQTISTATVAKSAAEAKELLFLRETDGITMNRDRLLADAKAKALSLVDGYTPPEPPTFRLAGESGRVGINGAVRDFQKKGMATAYDGVVSDRLARGADRRRGGYRRYRHRGSVAQARAQAVPRQRQGSAHAGPRSSRC